MRHFLVFCTAILLSISTGRSQLPTKNSTSDIYHAIQKLNFLGSALYIAAHPDDENTRLISYFSNEIKARTAYLSLTRGDGGQNLIGPELQELLGVLRTQELLAARSIDGGEQLFTRANDFGYSKHPKETLEIWNEEAVLGDVVWAIRTFKPDVIVNRFDHRTPGSTHGHHTSSAILGVEAFDLANNPTAYAEQLQYTETWKPKRLFFNTNWWFYGNRENFEKADKSQLLKVDVGSYYPVLGISNNEIAALASSQHLCQGFGRLLERGEEDEYLELLKGEMPGDRTNIFEGIDTSWSRVEGGDAIGEILYKVQNNFNFINPSVHLPQLIEAFTLLQKIKDEHWKAIKSEELRQIIADVAGLYLEASASQSSANPGESVAINVEVVNRSGTDIHLKSVSISGTDIGVQRNESLGENKKINFQIDLKIPDNAVYSGPYWLKKKGTLGMYSVENQNLIGKPETPNAYVAQFLLDFNGQPIVFTKPIKYRYARPDKGELHEPFSILPVATSSFPDKVLLFSDGKPREIPVTIKAHSDSISGTVQLCHGKGWTVDQESKSFEIAKKGDEKTLLFTLTPPSGEDAQYISPIIRINNKAYTEELITIAYDHIPTQSVLLPSEAKVVRLNLQKAGEHIGYIMGAGDEVPESLEQIGYTVQTIAPDNITSAVLDKFDAVVLGIRAYNVIDGLKFKQHYLLNYIEQGGTLIVQYNTAGRWNSQFENIAPYPLTISRDRVTNESSNVEIIAPDHELVNRPNKIDGNDFNGWVQERGLYFPDSWADEFTPILSMNDEDEAPKKGGLLIAPYGKGYYIYTGLSFFRELPAGVPGAYKLFANMLSVGKNQTHGQNETKG